MSTHAATAPAPRSAPMSRRAEILLVASRELRSQLLKKSAIISNVVMLVLVLGGIIAYGLLGGGPASPYRLGVTGADRATVEALTPALSQVAASGGRSVEVVDMSGEDDATVKEALAADGDAANHVDMVLGLAAKPILEVQEKADEAVTAGVTAVLQQQALAAQVTELGGDPATVGQAVAAVVPTLSVVSPPTQDSEDFGFRYALLMVMDIVLFIVIMGGGQVIAMGVVEEKASRIVEILLATIRPTSLLAGKVLGTGVATVVSYAVIAVAALVTARVMDVLPTTTVSVDAVVAGLLIWMIIGFTTFAVLFGAAGALVSRQEDVSSVTMPLIMLCMIPYMASFIMATTDTSAWYWTVLAYVPPFSAFIAPARLALGVSSWSEQLIAMAIAIAIIPVLVRAGAAVYTRAVTRMGSRVPLKEVLRLRPEKAA